MNGLDGVVESVQQTAGYVASHLADHTGSGSETNPSGEAQIGADVWADRLFFEELSGLDAVGAYASEERQDVADCGQGYSVAIDPLDGSSNLASNNAVGTIVGVYDAELPASGRAMVAAIMVLYGPYTTMAVARADSDEVGEFLLRDGFSERWGTCTIPETATVVGLAGKTSERTDACNALADELNHDLKPRYGGATVADLRQVLEYGGLFGYPATTTNPDGKLRVHFESAPLAYIVDAAGGRSTDGTQSLLDVDPDGLHARTPTFLGNGVLVEQVETALTARG